MKKKLWIVLVLVAVTSGVGLGVAALRSAKKARAVPGFPEGGSRRAILEAPDHLEVLRVVDGAKAPEGQACHDFRVLASVVPSPAAREKLVAAIFLGLQQGRAIASCFDPHHAIRATKGNERVDLVVCFECDQIYVYDSERGNRSVSLPTTNVALPVFEEILSGARKP